LLVLLFARAARERSVRTTACRRVTIGPGRFPGSRNQTVSGSSKEFVTS